MDNKPGVREVHVSVPPIFSREMPVTVEPGPNGLIEIRQANGIQGWHSGYVTPARAREIARQLSRLADAIEAAA